jgi:hypothetical protein
MTACIAERMQVNRHGCPESPYKLPLPSRYLPATMSSAPEQTPGQTPTKKRPARQSERPEDQTSPLHSRGGQHPNNLIPSRPSQLPARPARVKMLSVDQFVREVGTPTRPPWLQVRASALRLPEPAYFQQTGFKVNDLVLTVASPGEDDRPGDHARKVGNRNVDARFTDSPNSGSNGGPPDLSIFNHLSHSNRFKRHLCSIRKMIGGENIIALGQILRGEVRKEGQYMVDNVWGYYEIEAWGNEQVRKQQLEWTLYLLKVFHADRKKWKLPICMPYGRPMLKKLAQEVASQPADTDGSKMVKGTRLEAAIMQYKGLQRLAKGEWTKEQTRSEEGAVFADIEKNPKDTSRMTKEDLVDMLSPFFLRGLHGQPFEDAKGIATALRSAKKVRGERLIARRQGLEMSGPRTVPVWAERLSARRRIPAADGPIIVKPEYKQRPISTMLRLQLVMGKDIDLFELSQGEDNLLAVRVKLKAVSEKPLVGAEPTAPGVDNSLTQATIEPATSDVRPGNKRRVSQVSASSGRAQEEIKRARIENKKRRPSPMPASIPAQETQPNAPKTTQTTMNAQEQFQIRKTALPQSQESRQLGQIALPVPWTPTSVQEFQGRILTYADAVARVREELPRHWENVNAAVGQLHSAIWHILQHLPPFNQGNRQQLEFYASKSLQNQFSALDEAVLRLAPSLSQPQPERFNQLGGRQLWFLTAALRRFNPPEEGSTEEQVSWWAACCQLEARQVQLRLLAGWRRQWEECLRAVTGQQGFR